MCFFGGNIRTLMDRLWGGQSQPPFSRSHGFDPIQRPFLKDFENVPEEEKVRAGNKHVWYTYTLENDGKLRRLNPQQMEVCFRWFVLLTGWFLGCILIFQGVWFVLRFVFLIVVVVPKKKHLHELKARKRSFVGLKRSTFKVFPWGEWEPLLSWSSIRKSATMLSDRLDEVCSTTVQWS